MTSIILASQSPYRRALLQSAGLEFTSESAPVDERVIEHHKPSERARLRAEAKALATLNAHPDAVVIGCDQVAALGDIAFDKAESLEAAKVRLKSLSGKTHHLYSAWSIAQKINGSNTIIVSEVEMIAMPMRTLDDDEIDTYLSLGEWQGCVGCYQFENKGINLFAGVKADSSSIMGLPLQPLLAALRTLGINPLKRA